MMGRRLALILSVLSLFIGVMLTAACARGQWRAHWLGWARMDQTTKSWRDMHVVSYTSGIYVTWSRLDFTGPSRAFAYWRNGNPRVSGFWHRTGPPQPNPFGEGNAFASGSFNRFGFGYRLNRVTQEPLWDGTFQRYRVSRIHLPYWALIPGFLGAGLPSLLALIAWRRRVRRLALSHCRSCGYDVRASPKRCPECGTVVPTPLVA